MGRRLFSQARLQIVGAIYPGVCRSADDWKITNCVNRQRLVPEIITQSVRHVMQPDSEIQDTQTSLAAEQLTQIIIAFTNLCAQPIALKRDEVLARLTMWQKLDLEFERWDQAFPTHLRHRVTASPCLSDIPFSSRCHVYGSMLLANLFNHYRHIRIHVNEILCRLLDHAGCEDSNEEDITLYQRHHSQCQDNIERLARDICDSVPFYLNLDLEANSGTVSPRAVAGNLLVWPLYSVGERASCSAEMHAWIVKTLRMIAGLTGVHQCAVMAQKMQQSRKLRSPKQGP